MVLLTGAGWKSPSAHAAKYLPRKTTQHAACVAAKNAELSSLIKMKLSRGFCIMFMNLLSIGRKRKKQNSITLMPSGTAEMRKANRDAIPVPKR